LLQSRHGTDAAVALPTSSVVAALDVLVKNAYVRSLAAKDRVVALSVLRLAAERYGQALLDADLDLLEFLISSIDGEKDPRCLLEGFTAVRSILEVYQRQPDDSLHVGRLDDCAAELFEVLSCYFPIAFTPPPNDPYRISRDDLAKGLESTLVSETRFAPFLMPLILEKLSSILKQAKIDALCMLGAAAEAFGSGPLIDDAAVVWKALRVELLGPASEGLLTPEAAAAVEVATAAASCLTRCLSAYAASQDASLVTIVLADTCLDDLLQCTTAPGTDEGTFHRSIVRIAAVTRILGAVGRAGSDAAQTMAGNVFPHLFDVVCDANPGPAQILAWAVLCTLIHDIAASGGCIDASLVTRLAGASARLPLELQHHDVEPLAAEMQDQTVQEESLTAWSVERWPSSTGQWTPLLQAELQLSAISSLLGFNATASCLDAAQVSELLTTLVLTSAWIDRPTLAAASRSALVAAAAGPCLDAVIGETLPTLLSKATQLGEEAGGSRSECLRTLQRLSTADPRVLREVVMALDQAIQLHFGAVAHRFCPPEVSLVVDVLDCVSSAIEDVAMSSDNGKHDEASRCSVFWSLAEHMVDSAVLLVEESHEVVPMKDESALEARSRACKKVANVLFSALISAPTTLQHELGSTAASHITRLVKNNDSLDSCNGFPAAIFAGVMAALNRGVAASVLLEKQGSDVLDGVLQATLSLHDIELSRLVFASLATLLNKLDRPETDAGIGSLARSRLLPALHSATNQRPSSAISWEALTEFTRALIVRNSRVGDELLISIVEAAFVGTDAPRGHRVGELLSFVLQQVPQRSPSIALCTNSGAVVKSLWNQRAYVKTVSKLIEVYGLQQASVEGQREVLFALAHVFAAVSTAVLRSDAHRALSWMARCASALQSAAATDEASKSDLRKTDALLERLLVALCEVPQTEHTKQQAVAALDVLVPALLQCAQESTSAAVRFAALECLVQLAALPYTALHPHRRRVLRALGETLDDNKRRVRLQAVRCREAWTMK
jgi:hypothetical protein